MRDPLPHPGAPRCAVDAAHQLVPCPGRGPVQVGRLEPDAVVGLDPAQRAAQGHERIPLRLPPGRLRHRPGRRGQHPDAGLASGGDVHDRTAVPACVLDGVGGAAGPAALLAVPQRDDDLAAAHHGMARPFVGAVPAGKGRRRNDHDRLAQQLLEFGARGRLGEIGQVFLRGQRQRDLEPRARLGQHDAGHQPVGSLGQRRDHGPGQRGPGIRGQLRPDPVETFFHPFGQFGRVIKTQVPGHPDSNPEWEGTGRPVIRTGRGPLHSARAGNARAGNAHAGNITARRGGGWPAMM